MKETCPYCGKTVEIYCAGFKSGETYEQECEHCGRIFAFEPRQPGGEIWKQ